MKVTKYLGFALILCFVFCPDRIAYSQSCSFAGSVTTSGLQPISDVEISGCASDSLGNCTARPQLLATTDAGGSWRWIYSNTCRIPAGGITLAFWASKTCFALSPTRIIRTITATGPNTGIDFAGSQSGFYTISGNTGVPGATLNGLPGNPVSDASGNYTATVTCGWSGTVTPAKGCYSFNPASSIYTNVAANQVTNYAAILNGPYTISGNVGAAGVTLNGLPGNPVSDASGNYTATITCGWSGTVTPAKGCYSFNPASSAYTNVAASQVTNYAAIFNGPYTISGYIKTSGGAAIPGVTMNGLPGAPITNASGYYSTVVSCGFSGTATPSLQGYIFSPASISYSNVISDQTSQNYTGITGALTISGYVRTAGGAAIEGVTMSGLPGSPATNALGFYSASVSNPFTGTVTPTLGCFSFTPASITYSGISANQANQNYTGFPLAYAISGYVRTAAGAAIAGVAMNGLPGPPTTDASGYYSSAVSCGFTGTATPSLSGYSFLPASTSYSNVSANQTNQNYTGTTGALTISGYVRTVGGAAIAGVTMSGLPGSPATNASGFYSASVSNPFTGTVTPILGCFSFSPASLTYSGISTNQTNQNYAGVPLAYTISGYVRTAAGAAIAGVAMNGLPGPPTTDSSGYYSAAVPCGWSGTVTPTKSSYSFSPISATFANLSAGITADFTGTATMSVSDDLVISLGQGGGGWIEARGLENTGFAHKAWAQVSWSAYNTSNGETHVADGDLDNDGRKELAVGLGSGSAGWLEILDDASAGYAHKAWIQIDWPEYNSANGLTYPAIGDVDGDGKNEIVVGLGVGGEGWLAVFGNANAAYALQQWIRLEWTSYNESNGSAIPAVGDVDGDGKNEIVAGLGNGGQGYLAIIGYTGEYAHKSWLQVPWVSYNTANGATFPAIGDIDGNGKSEIIVGLGEGGGGWMASFENGQLGYLLRQWIRTSWISYYQIGETHPACIDVNSDGIEEVIIGLGRDSQGWLEILGNATMGFHTISWIQLPWNEYNQANGSTTPVP